jgi:hypothetical protein
MVGDFQRMGLGQDSGLLIGESLVEEHKPGREIVLYRVANSAAGISTRPAKKRRLFRWMVRWLGTSKPTEWMTSSATVLGVLAAIISGVVAYKSGFLDAKREALATSTTLLKIEQKELEQEKVKIDAQIKKSQEELSRSQRKLAAVEEQVSQVREQLAAATRRLAGTEDLLESSVGLTRLWLKAGEPNNHLPKCGLILASVGFTSRYDEYRKLHTTPLDPGQR